MYLKNNFEKNKEKKNHEKLKNFFLSPFVCVFHHGWGGWTTEKAFVDWKCTFGIQTNECEGFEFLMKVVEKKLMVMWVWDWRQTMLSNAKVWQNIKLPILSIAGSLLKLDSD